MGPLEAAITGRVLRTNHSHVVQILGSEIVAGIYPPGATLPGDTELADRFQVSRTVLREAMKTLSAKGLIVARARIGTRVTEKRYWNLFDAEVLSWHFENGVDQEFLTQLSEMRLSFEPFAAGLAAEKANDVEIEQLFWLAADMGRARTAETLAFADLKFHLAVVEASKNPFMRSVGSLIEAALVGVFKLSSPAAEAGLIEEVAKSHTRIVDAIRARDVAGAARAMENVILVGRDRVRKDGKSTVN